MKMNKIIMFLSVISLIIACKHDPQIKIPIKEDCENTNFTFVLGVKPLLDADCVSCHQTGSYTGVELETYDEVKHAVDSNNLLGSIIHDGIASPMPQGLDKWDTCKINIFTKWINDGAPNN